MNIQNSVSTLMTSNVHTLTKDDKLINAQELFDTFRIHHCPVVEGNRCIGMITHSDLLYFLTPMTPESKDQHLNDKRLKNYSVEEVMSKNVITISPDATIERALDIFCENLFHALPVEEDGELVGIITTHDIMFRLLHPPIH